MVQKTHEQVETKPNTSFPRRFLHRMNLIELSRGEDDHFTRRESVAMGVAALALAAGGFFGAVRAQDRVNHALEDNHGAVVVPGNQEDQPPQHSGN